MHLAFCAQSNSISTLNWLNRHKLFGIASCIHRFVSNFLRKQTKDPLLNLISYTGYHLIAYIRAWQMVLDEVAKQNGHRFAFRFNTYIVSVLVIFYLQLNRNFPKLEVLAPSRNEFNDHVPQVDAKHLKQAVQQFFEFYGKKYEKCKLISLNFGRWQNQKLDKKQHIISPERKKLVQFYAAKLYLT